ncbi:DUF1499 domain-containing protein [Vibrio pectenicida]|uniref:DUF1499 domain-containing protein n=1 Tax=Vibrio pectenicida TaxID=62763 RepID=A0A3R9G1P2_9VIBR|nr:DUF1499 domain-containing protein [Vibrio pectenicida]RSD30235.1 DUF1499 domain-containing protein [Vibrio pectenicida]
MTKSTLLSVSLLILTACSQGVQTMTDRTLSPCGDKPNCVSTQDDRDTHNLKPYILTKNANLNTIEQTALQLSGAKLAAKQDGYLRIECTSRIMRFTDDLELRIEGETLIVRSESRIGYSDFGVNRKRANQLRALLKENNIIF